MTHVDTTVALEAYQVLARHFGMPDELVPLALIGAGPPASSIRRAFMAALEESDRIYQARRAQAQTPTPESKP